MADAFSILPLVLILECPSSNLARSIGGVKQCRARRKLRSESLQAKPCRLSVLPEYPWPWRAARPHRLLRRQWIRRRRIPHRVIKSFSVRKSSPTSACPRSMFSTRKTQQSRSWAKKSLKAAGVAAAAAAVAAVAEAADAAGPAVAAAAVAAAAGSPGVFPGVVATPARRLNDLTALTGRNSQGRVLLGPACFFRSLQHCASAKMSSVADDVLAVDIDKRRRASPMTALPRLNLLALQW